MWGNQKSGARIELIGLEGGESKIKSNRLEPVHLIDDPAARLGLELGAPVASGGGGSGVGALRWPPVGVHGRGSAMAGSRGSLIDWRRGGETLGVTDWLLLGVIDQRRRHLCCWLTSHNTGGV